MKKRSYWLVLELLLALALLSSCGQGPRPLSEATPSAMPSGPPPREAETLAQQAEEAQRAGNIQAAISKWERIIQTYPGSSLAAKGLSKVGDIYFAQGQPEKSLQYYDYLLYNYPKWEGANLARVGRLRALAATGKRKQVMKEAMPLWEASSANPAVQVSLSRLMAESYRSEGDVETAFEWVIAGFSSAKTPEENKELTKATLDVLKDTDENGVRRLFKKKPSDFMKVFLEYRLAQIEMQKGRGEAAREHMNALLSQNPSHPLAAEIRGSKIGIPTPAAAAIPLNPNRVGCLVPMNGPYAKYGQLVLRGLSMAADEWNERHSEQRITLIVKDAQAESDLAIRSFEALAKEEGVMAVIGPLGAQAAKAVSPLAEKWGMPLLTLTQKEDDTPDNPFVLHIFIDNHDLVRTLVRYCREKLGYTRFAALYPDDRYGQKLSKVFSEIVQELGGNLIASVAYKEKSTDFKEPIQKLMSIAKKNAPPSGLDATPFEALFLPDQVNNVSMIAPQLPYYNVVGTTLLGTNLWGEAPLVQVGGAYVEQAIFATPFFADSQEQRVRNFCTRYEATYQSAPSYLEAQAYDALSLFLHARFGGQATRIDRASILRNLLSIRDYEGVAGGYSFASQGRLQRTYTLLQVQSGRLVQLSY